MFYCLSLTLEEVGGESIESQSSEYQFSDFIISPIKYVPWLQLIHKDIANREILSFRNNLLTVTGHKHFLKNVL